MIKWCGKILVAVDGSDPGHQLLRESIRLAHWIRAEMTLIHAAPPYNGDLTFAGTGSIEDLRREPCRRILDRVTEIAEEDHAFLKAICLEGEPAEIILETAQKESCDLVVMGVYPKNILSRIISGQTLKKVLARIRKNVMIFPPNTSLDWQKIILITDDSKYSALTADLAGELTRGYGGELIRATMPDIFRRSARQIIQTAKQQKAGLIIMPSPEISEFSLFRGDAFERFLSALPCPALICGVGS